MAKSFTSRTDTIPFDVNGVDFAAAGSLPADDFIDFLSVVGELGRLGEKAKKAAETEEEGGHFDIETLKAQKELMAQAVGLALLPESADRFLGLLSDRANPATLDVLTEVLMWLMEEYKLSAKEDEDGDEDGGGAARPTKPTSDSATGSSPTEDSSEDD